MVKASVKGQQPALITRGAGRRVGDEIAKEGQAQQNKAGAEEKAQDKEAEAQKARAEADKQEAHQKKNQ
jgi:hypothetical protein